MTDRKYNLPIVILLVGAITMITIVAALAARSIAPPTEHESETLWFGQR